MILLWILWETEKVCVWERERERESLSFYVICLQKLTLFSFCRTMIFIRQPNTWDMKWNIHFEPFKWTLWVTILVITILIGIGLTITACVSYSRNKRDITYQNLFTSILCIITTFCGQGNCQLINAHYPSSVNWLLQIKYKMLLILKIFWQCHENLYFRMANKNLILYYQRYSGYTCA